MTKILEDALTQGLTSGYAGKTVFTSIQRASFDFQSSHLETETLRYHDEWLNAHNGGGQELVQAQAEKATRLYAGGIPSAEKLAELGITGEQIISFLVKVISENPGQTRLRFPFSAEDGSWSYRYEILDTTESIELTIAKETISYNGEIVFVHGFLLSPIV
jgi:hypothetical protein